MGLPAAQETPLKGKRSIFTDPQSGLDLGWRMLFLCSSEGTPPTLKPILSGHKEKGTEEERPRAKPGMVGSCLAQQLGGKEAAARSGLACSTQ